MNVHFDYHQIVALWKYPFPFIFVFLLAFPLAFLILILFRFIELFFFSAMNTSAEESSQRNPSISDSSVKPVQIHSFNINHYYREEMYARVDQIMDPNNPSRDINRAHSRRAPCNGKRSTR